MLWFCESGYVFIALCVAGTTPVIQEDTMAMRGSHRAALTALTLITLTAAEISRASLLDITLSTDIQASDFTDLADQLLTL